MEWDDSKGYTVTYFSLDNGKPWVAERFNTREEMQKFLDDIHKPDSGWLDEELQTIGIVNDKNYMLPY